jgi:SAM-dependent methyltransferase
MWEDDRVTRGVSLEKATLYEAYRLPYAREAVDDLLQRVGEVEVVADVGAGTGQLARLFADSCERLYVVEPDEAMRAVARAALRRWPTIEIVAATAEHTTLPTGSVDLIVIGNAFHRFRPEACGELRRILRDHGWVAIFSYEFTDSTFTDMLFPRLATLQTVASRTERSWHRTPVEDLFGEGQTDTLTVRQSHAEDWEAFFGAARAGIEAPERQDADFVPFERINREVFDALSTGGNITIAYETRVLFGRPKVRDGAKGVLE